MDIQPTATDTAARTSPDGQRLTSSGAPLADTAAPDVLTYREVDGGVYLSERWGDPYRTVHGNDWFYAAVLVADHKLTTRQALAGCAPMVFAKSLEELALWCDQQDQLVQMIREYEETGEIAL